MKITIIALVATLCLAGVSAGFDKPEASAIDDFIPEDFSEEVVDIESYAFFNDIFNGFYWVLRGALTTLKGVNCTIKQVVLIRNSCLAFIEDIEACGSDAVAAFKNVISSVKSVIATCNNIIHFNENVCNNDESTNGKKSTSFRCFFKLFNQLVTLKNQTQKTLKTIKKVPAVPSDAAFCANTAGDNLSSAFTSFPANVKTCSKLVS